MKESVVEIRGHKYRYVYDSETKATKYLGPVGDSTPVDVDEEEFLDMIGRPGKMRDFKEMSLVDFADFIEDLDYSRYAGNKEWERWFGNYLNLDDAGHRTRVESIDKFGIVNHWGNGTGILLSLDNEDRIKGWKIRTRPTEIGWKRMKTKWKKDYTRPNTSSVAVMIEITQDEYEEWIKLKRG